MRDISRGPEFKKDYSLPYLLGVYLAVNAVRDACVVVDGLNCVMPKADLVSGNHDLFSTLFSSEGRHRVICTMTPPLSPDRDPDAKLSALLKSIAGSGDFAAVLLTALPFGRLAGMDYEGIARAVDSGAPVMDIPPRSLDMDWLDGYEEALDALARMLPPGGRAKNPRSRVALVGYMMDRNEFDHAANLKELGRLLSAAGLSLVSVWPSGGGFAELSRVKEAGLVVSLPYGRKAARTLAGKSGAALVETGLPMGLKGTRRWLETVLRAAGGRKSLPAAVLEEERRAAAAISAAMPGLVHKKVLFAGDPHLYSAFAAFAAEICMRASCALLDSRRRPISAAGRPLVALFEPGVEAARAAVSALALYDRPDLAVVNSFAASEGMACGAPAMELGFPSYGHHCLHDEPYMGFAGARVLAGRMLDCAQRIDLGRSRENIPEWEEGR